jgi:hypothetical protein
MPRVSSLAPMRRLPGGGLPLWGSVPLRRPDASVEIAGYAMETKLVCANGKGFSRKTGQNLPKPVA